MIQNINIGMSMRINSTFSGCISSKRDICLRIFESNFFFYIFPLQQRIPLDFLEGEKFQEAADNYVRPLLTKVSEFNLS